MKTKLFLVMALSLVGLFVSASFAQEYVSDEPQVAVEKQALKENAATGTERKAGKNAAKEDRKVEKQVMKEDRKAERDFLKEERKVEKELRKSEKER
jgi:hypothetical protein